jgi:hypothetical protein
LDDNGKAKKAKQQPAAAHDREFKSFGSTAVARRTQDENEPKEEKKQAVKPTFKGRMNLTKTGDGSDPN